MSAVKSAVHSISPGSPYVCMVVDARVSVKRAEKESPNESFNIVFHSLQLVERLLFMTELVHCGLLAQFSR